MHSDLDRLRVCGPSSYRVLSKASKDVVSQLPRGFTREEVVVDSIYGNDPKLRLCSAESFDILGPIHHGD